MYAEVATLQTLLEGVPLQASKSELIAYAQAQDGAMPLHFLQRLPEREYQSLDDVGEALAPVQVTSSNEDAELPREESDLPPGGDDYVNPDPSPGAVRDDAPPENPPQQAIEQQTKMQNEQKEQQRQQLDG